MSLFELRVARHLLMLHCSSGRFVSADRGCETARRYKSWSEAVGKSAASVAVLYASDYGYSDRLSQTLARGITKAGVATEMLDLLSADPQVWLLVRLLGCMKCSWAAVPMTCMAHGMQAGSWDHWCMVTSGGYHGFEAMHACSLKSQSGLLLLWCANTIACKVPACCVLSVDTAHHSD